MRLVRVGRAVWDMLAVEDQRFRSAWTQIKAEAKQGNRHATNMKALMEHTILNGPPTDPTKSDSLRDGIFEFKRGPKKGPKLRVLWFYDAGRTIICSHAFWKDQPTAPNEINKAVRVKRSYL